MNKSILVVDDDVMIVESLTYSLKKEGFQVTATGDGLEAVKLEQHVQPDIVILDIMLPSLDGWEVCRQIRQHSNVPIIMLTAKGDEFDRVLGLEMGADDYLPKPFSFRELLARIRATLRRVNLDKKDVSNAQIGIGAITIDDTAHKVYKDDALITITHKEYQLLLLLMSRAGQVINRGDLFDEVWGIDWIGDARTLDVHIRWLREKIEDDPSQPRYIQTVRGRGYRFAIAEEVDS